MQKPERIRNCGTATRAEDTQAIASRERGRRRRNEDVAWDVVIRNAVNPALAFSLARSPLLPSFFLEPSAAAAAVDDDAVVVVCHPLARLLEK